MRSVLSPRPPPTASYPRMPPASLGTLIDKKSVPMDKMSIPMDKEFVLVDNKFITTANSQGLFLYKNDAYPP